MLVSARGLGWLLAALGLVGCAEPPPDDVTGGEAATTATASADDERKAPSEQAAPTASKTPPALRSYRDFEPLDRGQARGERAGNPWTLVANLHAYGAELVWRLPAAADALSNRPDPTFPDVLDLSDASAAPERWHPVEYYATWACDGGVFTPDAHDCTNASASHRILSEGPDLDGHGAMSMDLWTRRDPAGDAAFYRTEVCDGDASGAILADPRERLPLRTSLPATGAPRFVGAPVCAVTTSSTTTSKRKTFVVTRVTRESDDDTGHIVWIENDEYSEASERCLPDAPDGATTTRADWGFTACLVGVELTAARRIGADRLSNGLGTYTVNAPNSGTLLPFQVDMSWTPTTHSFSIDVCDGSPFGAMTCRAR